MTTSNGSQRFRKTEYAAPIVLVLLLALTLAWLASRLWRDAASAPKEPKPGPADYRFGVPMR